MELFSKTRIKIGKIILSKSKKKVVRNPSFRNIREVKNIGIVWDITKTGEFVSLSRFYQKMHERKINVSMIGYYPGKYLPDQYTAVRYLTCLRDTDVNFFYIPVSSESEIFRRTDFDVLIDLNFDRIFPLTYLTSLSTATLKVGLFETETSNPVFDLMIELKKPFQVEHYLDQVIHYLEMINSGSPTKADKL